MLASTLRLLAFVGFAAALVRVPATAIPPSSVPLRTDLLQAAEQPIEDLPNRLLIKTGALAAWDHVDVVV